MPILCRAILSNYLGDPSKHVAEDTQATKHSQSGWTHSGFRCILEFLTKMRRVEKDAKFSNKIKFKQKILAEFHGPMSKNFQWSVYSSSSGQFKISSKSCPISLWPLDHSNKCWKQLLLLSILKLKNTAGHKTLTHQVLNTWRNRKLHRTKKVFH